MIDPITVGEIIKQYEKHGWELRRALLSQENEKSLASVTDGIPSERSDFDALWFSRRSNPRTEAWELRRLSGSPFALVAVISVDASDEERESTLEQVIDEMRAKTIA